MVTFSAGGVHADVLPEAVRGLAWRVPEEKARPGTLVPGELWK